MGKLPRACPFSGKACTECAVYRGRHRYGSLSKEPGRPTEEHGEYLQSGSPAPSVEFQALQEAAAQWAGTRSRKEGELTIRLRGIDVEKNEAFMKPLAS